MIRTRICSGRLLRLYLFGFRGATSIAGPGAGMPIENISTHISMRPCRNTQKTTQCNRGFHLFLILRPACFSPTCSMPGLSGFSRGRVSTCSGTSLQPTLGISSQWFSTVRAKCSSVCFFKPEGSIPVEEEEEEEEGGRRETDIKTSKYWNGYLYFKFTHKTPWKHTLESEITIIHN